MKQLPFTPLRTAAVNGREVARFVCTTCDAHTETPIVRSGNSRAMNPDATIQRAESAGWRVSGARVSCPRCQARSVERAKGESPGPKIHHLAKESVAMPSPTVREPTPQERVKIRSMLDKLFDDGAGCWLDGYSDQKAGEEIGVPWALVTKIREAAYGPIRVDPELAAIKAELVQIGRELTTLADKQVAALKRVEAYMQKRSAA